MRGMSNGTHPDPTDSRKEGSKFPRQKKSSAFRLKHRLKNVSLKRSNGIKRICLNSKSSEL